MTDELQRAMGRVESKVDILLERTGVYERRLTSVEKRVWWGSGVAAVVAFIASNLLGRH